MKNHFAEPYRIGNSIVTIRLTTSVLEGTCIIY